MSRILRTAIVTAFCALALSPAPAGAQTRCPEGRTAAGICVNPALASALRYIGNIFSHPKISQTAYPVAPATDRLYRYPNQPNPDQLRPAPTAGPPIP